MTHEPESWGPNLSDSDDWIPPLTSELKKRMDDARDTMLMLADQVGVRCCQCGNEIKGRDAVGMVSFMAPLGTDDYKGRVYCEPCADTMSGE